MRTFAVSKVAPADKPYPPLDRTDALGKLLRKTRVEQIYESKRCLVHCSDLNPFVQMAHLAFYGRRPIALSPDAVWFCIAQGFAHHVNLNVEALRHHFVKHKEGKVALSVENRDFILGRTNPWPKMFAGFSEQIAAHVGKRRDLVVADFSTTEALERAASEVVLMDAFQGYFEYTVMIGAAAGIKPEKIEHGIPSVTLLGTPEDWISVRRRAQMLSEFGLEHWTNVLVRVLDRIVETAQGKDDPLFWQSFFQSGRHGLAGWIHTLFPYLKADNRSVLMPNTFMANWESQDGPSSRTIPSGLASAPVTVIDTRGGLAMVRFVAGLFGVVEDRNLVLAPEFGWAITYA